MASRVAPPRPATATPGTPGPPAAAGGAGAPGTAVSAPSAAATSVAARPDRGWPRAPRFASLASRRAASASAASACGGAFARQRQHADREQHDQLGQQRRRPGEVVPGDRELTAAGREREPLRPAVDRRRDRPQRPPVERRGPPAVRLGQHQGAASGRGADPAHAQRAGGEHRHRAVEDSQPGPAQPRRPPATGHNSTRCSAVPGRPRRRDAGRGAGSIGPGSSTHLMPNEPSTKPGSPASAPSGAPSAATWRLSACVAVTAGVCSRARRGSGRPAGRRRSQACCRRDAGSASGTARPRWKTRRRTRAAAAR